MADLPSSSNAELAEMRKLFNEKLFYLYHERQIPCYEWRKREWIDDAIQSIETFYKEPNKLKSNENQSLAQKYEVSLQDGKKIIRIRKKMNGISMLEIVAMEDYFDILYNAHIKTNHGDRFKTSAFITNLKIFMPLRALYCFLSICKVCVAQKRVRKSNICARLPKRNYGLIEILDMRPTSDGEYNFVLYYKDVASDCTFLRPLRSRDVVEVSEELLKLFLQNGCPGILSTSIGRPFADAIILRLAMAWPECQILCGKLCRKPDDTLNARIRQWMTDNDSENWSKGVYYVSNEMNTSVNENMYGCKSTPLKRLLNKIQTKGLTISRDLPIFKDIKYEEDLEKIVAIDRGDGTSESADETDESDEEDGCKQLRLSDESQPGPSKVNKLLAKPKKSVKVPEPLEDLRVKHLPIKTYTKKAKTQVATTSQTGSNKDVAATFENVTDSNLKSNSKTSDPRLIKKTKPQTVQIAEETHKKVLCINKRLKGLTDLERMNKAKRKKQESWNTPAIDLPHNYSTDRYGRKLPITLSNEIFYLTENFGDITTPLSDSFDTDRDNDNNVVLFPKLDNVPELKNADGDKSPLCTILKVESLSADE